jgi:hypothetical protein
MKKFREFLENYDVYLDMPTPKQTKGKGKKKDVQIEISSNEDRVQENIANEVIK